MRAFVDFVFFSSMASFSGCSSLPQIADDAKEILTDDCITIKVDRDAFQKDTDIKLNLEVINKDAPSIIPIQPQ